MDDRACVMTSRLNVKPKIFLTITRPSILAAMSVAGSKP
jgi:hypothetical protein